MSELKCPICRKPRDEHYRPFCSRRCADIDLGRWLGERYAVPVEDDSEPVSANASGGPAGKGDENFED